MYQRDYIMRLIEQMSQAIGTILGLKRQLKHEEAQQHIGETIKRLFGLHPGLIKALPESDLIALLNRDGESTGEKMLLLARLLREEAELEEWMQRTDESRRTALKALNLTLLAAREGPSLLEGFITLSEEVDSILALLPRGGLPRETCRMLWPYYETAGRFANAEDVLFDLLDDPDTAAEAVRFYERLLALDDAALEAGRLPRNEVYESLKEIRRRLDPIT